MENVLKELDYFILINKTKEEKNKYELSSMACMTEFNMNNESNEYIYNNYTFNKLCYSIKNINEQIKDEKNKKLIDNFN